MLTDKSNGKHSPADYSGDHDSYSKTSGKSMYKIKGTDRREKGKGDEDGVDSYNPTSYENTAGSPTSKGNTDDPFQDYSSRNESQGN